MDVKEVERALLVYQNKVKAEFFPKFFKAEKGEYGEGDEFLGVTVPHIRQVAKGYRLIPLADLRKVLASKKHEVRLLGTYVLVWKFEHARDDTEQEKFLRFYLKTLKAFNNWDLVDASSYKILGRFLKDKTRSMRDEILVPLATHRSVWYRRIALIAQYTFIKNHDLSYPLKFFKHYLHDEHELIHKGLGWMLREMGKMDPLSLKQFLDKHHKTLRSVTISYATEKMPPVERRQYYKRHNIKIKKQP